MRPLTAPRCAVIEVEMCIADSGFGLFDRSARRPLDRYALVTFRLISGALSDLWHGQLRSAVPVEPPETSSWAFDSAV